ncbi:hypothetical protein WH5701_11234 [Synechococcus sp. WH 5701]|nr:hypothetical protein WH5701_11234 [Synechococcus sp. WH 5701]
MLKNLSFWGILVKVLALMLLPILTG